MTIPMRTFIVPLLAVLLAGAAGCDGDSADCMPSCTPNTCGPDGCGGRCGCDDGFTCNTGSGACECAPSCDGRACGDDGCGGSCGTCPFGGSCNPRTGQCQGGCVPSCDGRECGSDGCGGSCGGCTGELVCNQATGRCGAPCVPQCGGKVCGEDGCGGSCGDCGDGALCASGACVAGPSCSDNVRNGDESDVDCGGACTALCRVGEACVTMLDCRSGNCPSGTCEPADHCANYQKDGGETDEDCGGPDCAPCALDKYCGDHVDCLSDACVYGVCTQPTCEDGAKNQGETSADCGGPCPGCDDGAYCLEDGDCASSRCETMRCMSCGDGKRTGGEADVDCGGPCAACADGRRCTESWDCQGGGCEGGQCCTVNACGFCGALGAEVCDGKDNDCNGEDDDGLGGGDLCPLQAGVCAGARKLCYGEAGWLCNADVYAFHSGDYGDEGDLCDDDLDNDCDGLVDWADVQDCCRPQCDGKDCGDDGCGGTCGNCGGNADCSPAGVCQVRCGAVPSNSCDGYCGQQYGAGGCFCDGYNCAMFPGSCCIDFAACCTCEPYCDGRECGDDGCGGVCGLCTDGTACEDGRCEPVATDPCTIIGAIGCCKGGSVYWCETGNLYSQGCSADGQFCGWFAGDAYTPEGYYCMGSATGADPSGSWPIDCPAGI